MDNTNQKTNRALALAGILQCAYLVKQLAWKGQVNQEDFSTCIYSVFQTNPANTEAVYGGIEKLLTGINSLPHLIGDNKIKRDREIARYAYSLIHLERILSKQPNMLNTLQRGIERANNQAQHFSTTHENVLANLASIYTDTLSTFKFRIHITGETAYLSNSHIVNKLRAILLAGIRSAVLWRQLGGNLWQISFTRRSIMQDAQLLLEEAKSIIDN